MPRVSPYQGNFGSGEFSPLLYGRTDTDRYKSGSARLFNFIPTLQGAAARRPGARYVNTAISNAYAKLIPFKFSRTDAYMLEFGVSSGNVYIRFYTNRGIVETSPGVPYKLVTPYSPNDIPLIKYTQSLDTLYLACPNRPPQKLIRNSATNWTIQGLLIKNGPFKSGSYIPGINGPALNVDTLAASVYTPFSGTIVTVKENVITGITSGAGGLCLVAVTDSVKYLKTGDKMYIKNVVGTTEANGDWIVTAAGDNQFLLQGSTFVHAYVSGGTAIDTSFMLKNMLYNSNDDGTTAAFRYKLTGAATVWKVTYPQVVGSSGGRVYTALCSGGDTPPGSATAAIEYRMPGWGHSTNTSYQLDSFPTCVNFHEDRLYFGGAGGALQRIDGSAVADYENFSPTEYANGSTTDNTTITDSSAVSFSFLDYEANLAKWITSDEKGMVVGTSAGPWIVKPSTLNQAITPTNISAKKITSFGSSDFAAVVAGKASIFIEASGRKVREVAYFYDVDGFRAVDLSELSEHLPAPGISTELAFQNTPQNIVWTGRADGELLGITYDRNLDTLRTGWHHHQLGGVSDAAGTPPIVESLAVIPSPDGKTDDVWMVVHRYINGSSVRYIEYFNRIFESFDDPEDAFFVDCGASFDNPISFTSLSTGASVTTINKVAHGLATGDHVRFRNVVGLKDVAGPTGVSQINGTLFTITRIDADHFTIPLASSSLTAYVNDGNSVYRKMVSTVSGITWLEGQTVQILGDGAYMGTAVVTSGAVSIPTPGAGTIQFGLGYSSELQQLRLEAGAADGTSFGKLRRANEVAFMVERSGTFEYGINFTDMIPVEMREVNNPMDQAAPLFSGIKDDLLVPSGYDTENQICVRQNIPLPLTLLAIMPQQITYDKS